MNKLKLQNLWSKILLLTFSMSATSIASQVYATESIDDMSLEQLLEVDLFQGASLTPVEQKNAPGTVYSFTAADIQRMGVRRVDELLEFVPGMQTSQYRKRHKSITARGVVNRYNSKTLFLVDGRPMRHSYYGHYGAWDNFPIELIEKIEIIMGPSSAIYGANAFGGTISVTTRDFTSQESNSLALEVGNHSRKKLTNHYRNEHAELLLTFTNQDAPFSSDRYSLRGERPALQPLDEQLFSAFGKVKLNDEITVSADYQNLSYPFVYILNDRTIQIDERPLNLSANFAKGEYDSGRVEAVAYYNRDDVNETETRISTNEQSIESQDSNIWGFKLKGFKKFGSQSLVAGFEWRRDAADNMNVNSAPLLTDPNIEQDDFSVYLENVWSMSPNLKLTFGARYDAFDLYDSEFSPRLAAVFTPSERHTLKILYGEGVRTPTFREAFKVLDTNFVAPVPDSEHANMLEMVYNYQANRFSFGASIYRNDFEDYITEVLTPDGQDEYSTNSANDWHMQGLDIESSYKIGNLNIRGTISYLDIEEMGTDQEFPVADLTASLNLAYKYYAEHRFGMNFLYNSDRPDFNEFATFTSGVDPETDNPDGFIDISMQFSGPLGWRDVQYAIGASNLLDETIYDSQVDFNENIFNNARPEREFWLRLSKTF